MPAEHGPVGEGRSGRNGGPAGDGSPKPRRSGRRPGSGDTRGRILAAARTAFGERGYEGASVRDVAARAGVDAALVHHYFGTKQRLFLAASEFPVDVAEVVPRLLAGPREGLGERFVRFVVDLWDRPEVRPLLLGIVRSATTDPVAAAMMRGMLAEGPFLALARAIDLPDAQLRATLAGSQLIGIVMARYVVLVEPLATMTPAELAAAVGPTIERYLSGDIRGDDDAAEEAADEAAIWGRDGDATLAAMTNPAPAPDPAAALAREPAVLAARLATISTEAAADPAAIRVVHAPGRVNLIGEHTDYNDGYVLPAAIDLGIAIALLPTGDRRVEVTLAATGETLGFHLDDIGPKRGAWIDYVAGTAWALAEAGVPTSGFRGVLASDLPQGSGLSSSAALELASSLALCGGEPPPLDRMTLARTAQRAENAYVGVNCGLMDQFASAFGEAGRALLLDCRTLAHRSIPVGDEDLALVACHSGSPRRLETSAYNERRSQCEAAVRLIAERVPGVIALRDVTPAMLEEARPRLDPLVAARAEHVVRENERVLATVAALEAGDLAAVGRLFHESHASLRDLFGVSSPELDALVEIARATPGVVGARLTGAGFGGCTINLVRRDAVPVLRAAVLRDYPARTGLVPRVFEVVASSGARRIA